ncbi:unnamed protein product [Rhizoctonia solani]|uniref:ATP synthase subunit J, mitochondrial n=1 Tax=Rhizoctonia solani TaxID=456999 RepID=A0A8H3HT84_9AGAM|nr:unnamed protein product [Rhizoctonia solani]
MKLHVILFWRHEPHPFPPRSTHRKSSKMTLFGFRKWPTPIARPLAPFGIATLVTYYLVSKAQDAGVNSEEHRNSPKNPYAAQIAAAKAHH